MSTKAGSTFNDQGTCKRKPTKVDKPTIEDTVAIAVQSIKETAASLISSETVQPPGSDYMSNLELNEIARTSKNPKLAEMSESVIEKRLMKALRN